MKEPCAALLTGRTGVSFSRCCSLSLPGGRPVPLFVLLLSLSRIISCDGKRQANIVTKLAEKLSQHFGVGQLWLQLIQMKKIKSHFSEVSLSDFHH